MRRAIHTAAAVLAAVAAYVGVTLPPRHLTFPAPPPTTIAGAYHIHTTRSDGKISPDAVAAAAARAGLRFAILTDHGDATRVPDPPRYVDGVLLIDAVEISAVEGHIVALGLNGAAPYRLAGDARDVIDDVHRLGGMAIVAHPDSPRPELRWRVAGGGGRGGGPNGPGGPANAADLLNADGIEWLNADSERRDESWPRLLNAVLHLPVRPAETFTTFLERPAASMRRWDTALRRRTLVGVSGADAHGPIAGLYTAIFKSLAQVVQLNEGVSGDAARDADAVLGALRSGRTFSVVTGIGSVVTPELTASDNTHRAGIGDHLTRVDTSSGDVHVRASVPGASQARLVIRHNDRVVAEGQGIVDVPGAAEPGAYRLEAWLGDHRVPWIVTNPVYVDPPGDATNAPTPARPAPPPAALQKTADTVALPYGGAWASEHSAASSGTLAAGATPDAVEWHWQLGTSQPATEFSAAAHPVQDGADTFDRIEFTASADAPMRMWVQFRMPGAGDQRWGRSIYLDATPRHVVVRMSELTPQGFSATRRPLVAKIKALLLVVDTLHTPPGRGGVVHLSEVQLLRSEPVSGPNGQQEIRGPREEQQVGRPGRQGGRQ